MHATITTVHIQQQSDVMDSGDSSQDSSGEDEPDKQLCVEMDEIEVEHSLDYLVEVFQQLQTFEIEPSKKIAQLSRLYLYCMYIAEIIFGVNSAAFIHCLFPVKLSI